MKFILIVFSAFISVCYAQNGGGATKSVADPALIKKINECLRGEDKATVQCTADALGSDPVVAKDKIESLSQTSNQNIKDYLKAKGDDILACVADSAKKFLQTVIPMAAKITAAAVPVMINSLCTAFDYVEEKKNEIVDSEMVFKLNKCLKQDENRTQCMADVLGGNIYIAKIKAEALLKTAPQQIKEFLKVKGGQIQNIIEHRQEYYEQYKEIAKQWYAYLTSNNTSEDNRPKRATQQTKDIQMVKQLIWALATASVGTAFTVGRSFCTAYRYFVLAQQKVGAMKETAGQWFTYFTQSNNDTDQSGEDNSWSSYLGLGRRKRDIPTQAEIGLAQRVITCMKTNSEMKPDNCLTKILGSNQQKIDTVKLQTIILYESLLQELKEFFKAKEQGKTLQEFLESKKQGKASN